MGFKRPLVRIQSLGPIRNEESPWALSLGAFLIIFHSTKFVVKSGEADDGMAEVVGLFAQYAACKHGKVSESETLKVLVAVTDRLRRVITEMYHLCGSEKERAVVRGLKSKLP